MLRMLSTPACISDHWRFQGIINGDHAQAATHADIACASLAVPERFPDGRELYSSC